MTNIIKLMQKSLYISENEAKKIIDKAILGGETSEDQLEDWFNNRFIPNCVFIDADGYAKMCVDALKISTSTAATDYGSSRQRDLGQLWSDMTRGYLGEYAFQIFLEKKWGIKSKLGHELGELEEYLSKDIHKIKPPNQGWREPNLRISIKTTKWNGIWFDIPNEQFHHSDIHVLVKVGTGRDHLFAFFKHLSVFKDKVLKKGTEVGILSKEEADDLFENLPTFKPIPAYICGFIKSNDHFDNLSYEGKMGKKIFTIKGWNGPLQSGDLEKIKELEGAQKVKFESIGNFSHDRGYLFNTGKLLWTEQDWEYIHQNI